LHGFLIFVDAIPDMSTMKKIFLALFNSPVSSY
jgi:hypothetical protein